MADPSYYFTLYKKLAVLGHVPEQFSHGTGAGGFNLSEPHSAFGSSDHGDLLGATNDPADSPLWAILNSRASGKPAFFSVDVGGTSWPTMPAAADGELPAWDEFQKDAPDPALVAVLGDWISAGKSDDVPDDVLAQVPEPIRRLGDGVLPFAANMPGDDGVEPLPEGWWATSLIFLVDPATGDTVNPGNLSAADEYLLVAVIGNRGNKDGGRFAEVPGPRIEADARVMVWNSSMSPAVSLPALSNLDTTSTAPAYESYFLRSGGYDTVGFRLPVQAAFDGLVKAVEESVTDLGGLTAEEWVRDTSAHLCAVVRVRKEGQAWPAAGDPPTLDRRVAQRNLAPFAVDLKVEDPDPDIDWRKFMAGDSFRLWRFHERWGATTLSVGFDAAS